MAPIIGMMMSPTSEVTIAPKATPMMTPTARSTTLPFMAKSRNSFSIRKPSPSTKRTGSAMARGFDDRASIDQAGVHHGAAYRCSGGLGHRHHRQPQRLIHLAQQRQRIFDRRRIGL